LRPLLPVAKSSPARGRSDADVPEDGVPQTAYELLLKSLFEDSAQKRELILRRALDVAPDYLRARIELAQLYRETGQTEKATSTLARIATRDRELAAQAENLSAEIELEQGRSEVVESTLRRSLATRETARAHLLLARIALSRGDRDAARRSL